MRTPIAAARRAGVETSAAAAMTDAQRDEFWKRSTRTDTCWLWSLSTNQNGYGRCVVNSVLWSAHRLAYALTHGGIDSAMEIDHLCRNRRCVNPDHLELVTHRENTLRGETVSAAHAAQTHCVNGHEFTPENTKRNGKNGRACRVCHRAEYHARKARSLEAGSAHATPAASGRSDDSG